MRTGNLTPNTLKIVNRLKAAATTAAQTGSPSIACHTADLGTVPHICSIALATGFMVDPDGDNVRVLARTDRNG